MLHDKGIMQISMSIVVPAIMNGIDTTASYNGDMRGINEEWGKTEWLKRD